MRFLKNISLFCAVSLWPAFQGIGAEETGAVLPDIPQQEWVTEEQMVEFSEDSPQLMAARSPSDIDPLSRKALPSRRKPPPVQPEIVMEQEVTGEVTEATESELPQEMSLDDFTVEESAASDPKRMDGALTDEAFAEPGSFVIEDVPATDLVPQAGMENAAEKLRRDRIAYRKAKTAAQKEASIQQLLEIAESAGTMEEKRAALRKYYELLHESVVKINPELEDYSASMRNAHLNRVTQANIEPTIPLAPPPVPDPSAPPSNEQR